MQQPTILRIAIVGSGGVGKSSLTLQFVYSEFIQDYEPTKANSYRRKITLDGVPLQFDILDTAAGTELLNETLELFSISTPERFTDIKLDEEFLASQEDYRGIRDYFFKISEGFILVFAIDDSESVNSLATFREHILRIKQSDHVPMLIVANKCDLKGCTRNNYISQGKQYADDWHLDFIETSAKTYSDAERVFLEIGKKIRESHMASIQYPRKVENYKRRKKCTIL